MTLTFNTTRNAIVTLLAIFLFTSLFTFTLFMPAKVEAGLPVFDAIGTAASWAINKLGWLAEKAWDGVKWVAEKAWDVAVETAKWIAKNAVATLIATGLKIAAKFLLKHLQELINKRKIESVLYYADFLVRNVYSLQYIAKNYEGDKESQLILASLINEGNTLYSRQV